MNIYVKLRIGIVVLLTVWTAAACANLKETLTSETSNPTPSSTAAQPDQPGLTPTIPSADTTSPLLGSISGSIRVNQEPCTSLRVFAHEINTQKVTSIQTPEGQCTYTIPDLPAGEYWVVGWYYPTGVSGAYVSVDTVMALNAEDAQACEDAILDIRLKPGEAFTGADIGCWGGDFFDLAQPQGFTRFASNRWKLTAIGDQALLPGTGITLMAEDDQFYGSAGCNNYGGTFTTFPGGGLSFNEVERTAMYCSEPEGIMEQEDRYFAALTRTHHYVVLNNILELIDTQDTTLLIFERMPEFTEAALEDLVGKTWLLVSSPGLKEIDLRRFTLRFDEQNFSGTTTCRDYAGTYLLEGDRISIGFLEMTSEVTCEETLLVAEMDFTTLLETIDQYNLLDDRLELYTLKGEELVFEQVVEGE